MLRAVVRVSIRILLRCRAQELGAAFTLDMEQSMPAKDLTLFIPEAAVTEDEFRDRTDLGITIQAARQRARCTGLIRLVKSDIPHGAFGQGAYWDCGNDQSSAERLVPAAFQRQTANDANFERQ